MPIFKANDLAIAIEAIYRAKGASSSEARTVTQHQISANLVGYDSHGVIMTPRYVHQINVGELIVGAELTIDRETSTTAVLSGNWGFGFVMTEQAMQMGIDKAREHGVSGIVIRKQGHVGHLGAYAATAADHGMIALITADSGRGLKSVAPFGGRSRRLGTNPICIAVPSGLDAPLILDMATSAVAVGKLAVARDSGREVPTGWIVAKDGSPSTDPSDYYNGGAILPLGGDQGYKGFGLSVIVEILSGLLTGLGFGVAIDGRHNDGNFIAVFDVSKFRDLAGFKDDVDDFIRYLKESPLADGADEILYPGELEHRTFLHRSHYGIEIVDATWSTLEDLMIQLEVEVPKQVASRSTSSPGQRG